MVNKTLVWTKKYLQVKWDQSNNYLCNNNSVIIIITQYFIVIKFVFFLLKTQRKVLYFVFKNK